MRKQLVVSAFVLGLMFYSPDILAQSSNWGNEGNQLAATFKRNSDTTDVFGVMCHNDGAAYVMLMSTGRQMPNGEAMFGSYALAVHWSVDGSPLSEQQTWWLMKERGAFSLRRSSRHDAGTVELIQAIRSGGSIRIRVLDPGTGGRVVMDERFSLAGSNRTISRLRCV